MFRMPTFAISTVALLAAVLVPPAFGSATVSVSDTSPRASAFAVGAKPPATVRLRACRSAAYYDNRLVSYRIRMGRFSDTNAPQTLQVRIDVLQKLREGKHYARLKASGLHTWTSSSDAATVYQRDLRLTDVETAATYKARVSFRWVAQDGTVQFRRTITGKSCKQKKPLPRLALQNATEVPSADSTDVIHTLTVANTGRSEAVDVPVAVVVDNQPPLLSSVDSIGPRQSVDVVIRAPACSRVAYAQIDPLRALLRLRPVERKRFPLPNCS